MGSPVTPITETVVEPKAILNVDETSRVLAEVLDERRQQEAKWGVQSHPHGTSIEFLPLANEAKTACDESHKRGDLTWRHILNEEVLEAFAEVDEAKLRDELIQVAAVAVAAVEDMDRKKRGQH